MNSLYEILKSWIKPSVSQTWSVPFAWSLPSIPPPKHQENSQSGPKVKEREWKQREHARKGRKERQRECVWCVWNYDQKSTGEEPELEDSKEERRGSASWSEGNGRQDGELGGDLWKGISAWTGSEDLEEDLSYIDNTDYHGADAVNLCLSFPPESSSTGLRNKSSAKEEIS